MEQTINFLNHLNDEQKQAVTHFEGPLLILAGAGSGKTRSIIYRIAYLVNHYGVNPSHILALTFSNKAAREIINRLQSFTNNNFFKNVHASTFHSFGYKFLIKHYNKTNLPATFHVIDEEEQKRLINEVMINLELSKDNFPTKYIMKTIDDWKNHGMALSDFLDKSFLGSFLKDTYKSILSKYEELKDAKGLVDFGDLLLKPYLLLKQDKELLDEYATKFHFVLVDEYQDTNLIQYKILKLLVSKHRNITVVGDDDQSIYSFRGAEVRNILDFKKDFPDAKIISLVKNYRSTKTIIEAANAIIKGNKRRMQKHLHATKDHGDKIKINIYGDEKLEAQMVIDEIIKLCNTGHQYKDIAIFYRTNQLSRRFEDALRRSQIPYKVYGGIRFYSRKEIKDMLAFIRFLCNKKDTISFSRLASFAMPGVGNKTLEHIYSFTKLDINVIDAIKIFVEHEEEKKKISQNCKAFLDKLEKIERAFVEERPSVFIDVVIKQTNYVSYLVNVIKEEKELDDRLKNIEELKIALNENFQEGKSYADFINELMLDNKVEDHVGDHVTLMTVHASKGLEFPVVFITALEDDIFPHIYSKEENNDEEERRLFYVAITRAKEKLYLSYVTNRNGKPQRSSPFLNELPAYLIEGKTSKNEYSNFDDRKSFYERSKKGYESKVIIDENLTNDKKRGENVYHELYGKGKIIGKFSQGENPILIVQFVNGDIKRIASSFLRFI